MSEGLTKIKENVYGSLAVFMLLGYQPGAYCHALLMQDMATAKAMMPAILRVTVHTADEWIESHRSFVEKNFPDWMLGDADVIANWPGIMNATDGMRVQLRLEYGRDPWFMRHVKEYWIDHLWDPKNVPAPAGEGLGQMWAKYPRWDN